MIAIFLRAFAVGLLTALGAVLALLLGWGAYDRIMGR